MTEAEQQCFEAELGRVAPAPVPAELLAKLRETRKSPAPSSGANFRRHPGGASWWRSWRWVLAGGTGALAALALVCVKGHLDGSRIPNASAASTGMQPNLVRVDHSLVSSFDAVAELPDGEPVRFRCRKWMDAVQMQDAARGLVIEQTTPRVEVVAVRFETY